MDNLSNSDIYDGFVNVDNSLIVDKVIDPQNSANDQIDSPVTESPLSTENKKKPLDDSYFDKVKTSSPKPVLKKMKWHIVKFPFKKDAHKIASPVLTDMFGHRIQLIFQWSNDEGVVNVNTHKLNEATKDDLENWQKLSFSLSIGNKLAKVATNSNIGNMFSLGREDDIKRMLDGNDLILEFIISTETVVTSKCLWDELEAKLIGKMAAFFILILFLVLSAYQGSPQTPTEPTATVQGVTDLRQSIINLNNNLNNVDLDTARLIEILDNHSYLASGANDAIKLLRKSLRSYEKQLRKLDLILEASVFEQRRSESVFLNFVDEIKKFLCNLSVRFLPKKLQLTSCSNYGLFD